MSTIYGAFAYTPLSEWPVYTRAGMYQALERAAVTDLG